MQVRWMLLAFLGLVFVPSLAHAQDDGEGAANMETAAGDEGLNPEGDPDEEGLSEDETAKAAAEAAAAAEEEKQEFNRELKTVEEDVSNLKERVFRSKATLALLKELVVDSGQLGSRVSIYHVNKLGGSYTMEAVKYFLNGKNVFTKVDPGGTLDTIRELKVHEQTVPPGTHQLNLLMTLRGKGYKIFSYLRTYQFNVQSSYAFRVEEGKMTVIRVLAESKGGFRSFVERPNISYEEQNDALREDPDEPAASEGSGKKKEEEAEK